MAIQTMNVKAVGVQQELNKMNTNIEKELELLKKENKKLKRNHNHLNHHQVLGIFIGMVVETMKNLVDVSMVTLVK